MAQKAVLPRIKTFVTDKITPKTEDVDREFNAWMQLHEGKVAVVEIRTESKLSPKDGSPKLHYVIVYIELTPEMLAKLDEEDDSNGGTKPS